MRRNDMTLFDRFKKRQTKKPSNKDEAFAHAARGKGAAAAEAPQPVVRREESKEREEKKPAAAPEADERASSFSGMLLKPHVSEKAAVLADAGIYVFDVPVSANKIEIAKAVEATYKVKVEKVRTQRGMGKLVRRGRVRGRRNAWKKALVELKKGQTITLVEGV
jgi:large subunit ribosomal protein L23